MTDLEKAEKLREKAGVSYTDAKDALDNTDGSLLDALVYLEKQGKVDTPPGGGFYSGANTNLMPIPSPDGRRHEHETFSDLLKRLGRFIARMLDKGMRNFLVLSRRDEQIFSLPVIAFIALLLFFFWITLPIFIISLFCGIRYHFEGPDLEKDSVNNVMKSASTMAEDVKKTFAEEVKATKDAHAEAKQASDAKQAAANKSEKQPQNDEDEVIYY